MPQAIVTRYLPPTNTKGARIKAECDRGSVTVGFYTDPNDNHKAALVALVLKFMAEDEKKYGTKPSENPWRGPWIEGGLPNNGGSVFVSIYTRDSFEVTP